MNNYWNKFSKKQKVKVKFYSSLVANIFLQVLHIYIGLNIQTPIRVSLANGNYFGIIFICANSAITIYLFLVTGQNPGFGDQFLPK